MEIPRSLWLKERKAGPVIPKRERLASDWAIVATLLYLMLADATVEAFLAIRHYNYGSPERLAPIWY